jgi:hypothetical protein
MDLAMFCSSSHALFMWLSINTKKSIIAFIAAQR